MTDTKIGRVIRVITTGDAHSSKAVREVAADLCVQAGLSLADVSRIEIDEELNRAYFETIVEIELRGRYYRRTESPG